jgi:hypothetical protein
LFAKNMCTITCSMIPTCVCTMQKIKKLKSDASFTVKRQVRQGKTSVHGIMIHRVALKAAASRGQPPVRHSAKSFPENRAFSVYPRTLTHVRHDSRQWQHCCCAAASQRASELPENRGTTLVLYKTGGPRLSLARRLCTRSHC